MVTSVYLVLKFSSGLEGLMREGEEIGEDQRPCRPSTSKTDANIENVGENVRKKKSSPEHSRRC